MKLPQIKIKKKFVGTCVGCGKSEELSKKQIYEGQQFSAAMSTCCGMPLTLNSVGQ